MQGCCAISSFASVTSVCNAGGERQKTRRHLKWLSVKWLCVQTPQLFFTELFGPQHISGTRRVTYTSAVKWLAGLGRAGAPAGTMQHGLVPNTFQGHAV